MKEVIRIQDNKVQDNKPVEFTHILLQRGWYETGIVPSDCDKVVYLGKCSLEGDMFACYPKSGKTIHIFKGNINSGKY